MVETGVSEQDDEKNFLEYLFEDVKKDYINSKKEYDCKYPGRTFDEDMKRIPTFLYTWLLYRSYVKSNEEPSHRYKLSRECTDAGKASFMLDGLKRYEKQVKNLISKSTNDIKKGRYLKLAEGAETDICKPEDIQKFLRELGKDVEEEYKEIKEEYKSRHQGKDFEERFRKKGLLKYITKNKVKGLLHRSMDRRYLFRIYEYWDNGGAWGCSKCNFDRTVYMYKRMDVYEEKAKELIDDFMDEKFSGKVPEEGGEK